jgi:hypothetical protein
MYFNTEILSKVENSTRKSQIFLKEFWNFFVVFLYNIINI